MSDSRATARSLVRRSRPRAPRVLVTGAGGFLGRHVVRQLRQHRVPVAVYAGDVRQMGAYRRRFDVVCHLAGITKMDARYSLQDLYDVNVNGTLAVLDYCQRTEARCVLASSSAVYRPAANPRAVLDEEAMAEPVSPYGVSKLVAEGLCRYGAEHRGVSVMVLRIFNPYGPAQPPEFLMPYVLQQVVRGEPVVLRTPNAVRDFVYVADASQAIAQACTVVGERYLVLNIGSGVGISVRELVGRLAAHLEVRAVIREPDASPEDSVVADIRRAVRRLPWRPVTTLAQGVARILRAAARHHQSLAQRC